MTKEKSYMVGDGGSFSDIAQLPFAKCTYFSMDTARPMIAITYGGRHVYIPYEVVNNLVDQLEQFRWLVERNTKTQAWKDEEADVTS